MAEYLIKKVNVLYRRFPVLENPNYSIFWKLENGKKIPTSAAFKTKPNEEGLSLNIAALTTIEKTIKNPKEFGIAEFSAEIPINLGFECKHDPKYDNYAHALILGDTKPIAKKLSKGVTRVIDQSL